MKTPRSLWNTFLAATLSLASLLSLPMASSNLIASQPLPNKDSSREYYELRQYTLKTDKLPLLDEYLEKALFPALKRLGIGPIGAFSETLSPDKTALSLLIVFSSPDQPLQLNEKLQKDSVYLSAASSFLEAKAADPVYERIESHLLGAIAGMPKLDPTDPSKPRLLNLRIYESHNERAARKKQEMFNVGELAIFKKCGLRPVLFAESLAGPNRPNLTYLLVFNDDEARKAAWKTFSADPDWNALKSKPEYADKEIVSRITNKLLIPRPYSGL